MLLSARYLGAVGLALLPTTVCAHTDVGSASGLAHGFMHPVSGLDHVLAMVAVGLFASHLGGRALWLLPLAFVGMLGVGGVLGSAGTTLPLVEFAIALSVVVLGTVVALRFNVRIVTATGMVGFFAIFHGHAHGAEIPELASGFAYGTGFILATALLHGIGIGLWALAAAAGRGYGHRVVQAAGGVMALAGLAVLGGAL